MSTHPDRFDFKIENSDEGIPLVVSLHYPDIRVASAEEGALRDLLAELYEYVKKIEGPYAAQASVRGYMKKPDELHPGVADMGAKVRRVLGQEAWCFDSATTEVPDGRERQHLRSHRPARRGRSAAGRLPAWP